MLYSLGWQPLAGRRADAKLYLLYKIVYGMVAIPAQNYLLPLARTSRLHHNKSFIVPHSNSDYHLYSFFPHTIRLWNALPQYTVDSPTLDAFKVNLLKTHNINLNTQQTPVA